METKVKENGAKMLQTIRDALRKKRVWQPIEGICAHLPIPNPAPQQKRGNTMKAFHICGAPPYHTNSFLLIGNEGHAVVIDPAASAEEYQTLLREQHATLTHILLTHGHHDHVTAAQALQDAFGAEIRLGSGDARGNRLFPLQEGTTKPYAESETIVVDEMSFAVLATPGHSQGCVCLLCEDLLFSGDTLFAGDVGRTDLEGSDPAEMARSLQKLYAFAPDTAQVLPGHDVFSNVATEKQKNPYFRAG